VARLRRRSPRARGIQGHRQGGGGEPPSAARARPRRTDSALGGIPEAKVGITLNLGDFQPGSEHPLDVAAARAGRRQSQPTLLGAGLSRPLPRGHARALPELPAGFLGHSRRGPRTHQPAARLLRRELLLPRRLSLTRHAPPRRAWPGTSSRPEISSLTWGSDHSRPRVVTRRPWTGRLKPRPHLAAGSIPRGVRDDADLHHRKRRGL
jgi:hypothetical protein